MRRTIALVTAVSMTGCSFFLTRGPDSVDKPTTDPDCTDSMTWPVVDGTLGGLFLISALAAASDDDMNIDDTSDSNDDAIGAFVLLGAAAAAGAIVGYSRVSKCKTAQRKYRESYPYGNQPYPYGGYQPYPAGGYPPQGYPQQGYYPPQQQPYPPPAAQQQPYPPPPPTPVQPDGRRPVQPAPAPAPPAAKPAPIPPWSPPAPAPPPPAAPKAAPKPPPPTAQGSEGDVCVADNECASGLTCSGNVCLKKSKTPTPWPKKP